MTRLGTLGGSTSSAVAINKYGDVVGNSTTVTGTPHAFLWTQGRLRNLGTLPGATSSSALAINDHRQVIGISGTHSFLWSGGHLIDLPPLPGDTRSVVTAVNNDGLAVGYSEKAYFVDQRAVMWRDGTVHPLNSPTPDAVFVSASDVNDKGQILIRVSAPTVGMVVWQNGTITTPTGDSAGTLGSMLNNNGLVVGNAQASYYFVSRLFTWIARPGNAPVVAEPRVGADQIAGVNDRGTIVGEDSSDISQQATSYLWHAGVTTQMGSLGGLDTYVRGLNNCNHAVGASTVPRDSDTRIHAFYFSGGRMTDIGPAGLNSAATAINDAGTIAGYIEGATGQAVVWKPTR